ncbi:DUF4848 domain-containing protein [Chitinophaga sp. G-6-1-13]|uniref:DUF4848 domain-containing protein n=1 Tax=Chitinophaga fulva TaxID=2728842 RepID=A0A848GEL7_9BACT|nr:DUF4848 domain-containing protein [Chitinophaga fulva]NML36944.1 DUF4848 domain-containing protein [Chitinophaga fulva]
MKINLMMRTSVLLMFVFLSCKKDASIKENDPVAKDSPVKVVDGVLHFSNDQAFVQTMLAVNAMSPEQREAWEKKMGFTSIRSLYHQFNQELDKMEGEQNKDGFFAVKNKYTKVAAWSNDGTSYDINCRGILEAGVVNADGLVQINDQLLQYSRDQITTSSIQPNVDANARKANGGSVIWTREKKNLLARDASALIAYGGHAVVNQLKMGEGGIISAGPQDPGPEAKAYAQVRVYNFLLNGQNRGFCTVYFRAEHRNWIGIMRPVNSMGGGIHGNHYVTLNNEGDQVFFSSGGWGEQWQTGPNWSHGFDNDHEIVIIASTELKNSPTTISYLPPYLNSQLGGVVNTITENGSTNNFWQRYVPFGLLGYPLSVKVLSIGTYPLAKTHVFVVDFK